MSIATSSHINSIQALRGFAALAVALLHLAGLQMLEGFRETTGLYRYGWMGVDVFFIISGFIMVWVTQNITASPKTAWRFLVQRAVRIYPLWWVCVSFVALFFFLIHGVPASIDIVPPDQAWGFYGQSLLLIPQERAPLLGEGWTLIHELFFYCVFTIIIATKMRGKILWALATWALINFIGIKLGFSDLNAGFKIIFSPLSFLFMAGALIGSVKIPDNLSKLSWWVLGASIVAVLTLLLTGTLDKSSRVVQLIIPLSFLLWSLVTLEQTGRLKVYKPFIALGNISYALYLTHPLVILAWRVIRPFYAEGLFHGITSGLPKALLVYLDMFVLLAAFLITAMIFHLLVEKPSLRFFKSKLRHYKKDEHISSPAG